VTGPGAQRREGDLALALRLTWALLVKDLRIAARSRETFVLVALFAVLCVLLFAFGFGRGGQVGAEVVPGALWVTLQFTSTIALLRLFAAEEEAGALPLALRSLAGPGPLFFAKALTQLLFSALVCLLVLPLVLIFFDATHLPLAAPLAALALGLVGQAVVGTLIAALMVHVRLREVLLPLLFAPVVAPLLIAGVKVTALALAGGDSAVIATWLRLMLIFDLVFVLASPWLHARAALPPTPAAPAAPARRGGPPESP
jgi:heme exporter protein B